MPAYFENGIFTDNEPAWHRAGIVSDQEFLTVDEILKRVPELGSTIVKAPLYGACDFGEGTKVVGIPGRYATIRELDHKGLGTVSSRYALVQPRVLFEFGEAIVDAGGRWKTAGSLEGGKRIWGMLKLPGEVTIAGLPEEQMVPYLSVHNSFDGTTGVGGMVHWTRIVCKNTFDAAVGQAPRSFSLRHTEGVEGRLAEARRALGITFAQGEAIADLGAKLIAHKMTKSEAEAFLANLVPFIDDASDPAKQREETLADRADIMHVFQQSPNLQNITGTAWGLLQATFEFDQFYARPKQTPNGAMKHQLAQGRVGQRAATLLTSLVS